MMKAIDRVMSAYAKRHPLTEEQAIMVRSELVAFIDELLSGKKLENSHWPRPAKPITS
jgi:hypothetical protein